MSTKLPKITKEQRAWIEELGRKKSSGFVNRRSAWCGDCGHSLPTKDVIIVDLLKNQIVCPHCGQVITLKHNSLGDKQTTFFYIGIITTFKSYQVFRTFFVKKQSYKNRKATLVSYEVMQNWVSSEGKSVTMALSMGGGLCGSKDDDYWQLSSDLSIKHSDSNSYYGSYYGNKYDFAPNYIYPIKKYLPELTKKGYSNALVKSLNMAPHTIASNLLQSNEYEYLAKTNQLSMFSYMCKTNEKKVPFKYAVNICNRNKYKIEDASMWVDMMKALEYVGKDTHNPHYICPTDLKSAHDYAMSLKSRKINIERAEQKAKEIVEWEQKYFDMKSKYFDLVISNDNLTIKVLSSVAEFVDEGSAMHHCVFTNEYFKKEKCLVLSARNKNGERVETIEVSLDTYRITQSRGVCNSQTPFHDEIMNLVNENMYLIQNITEGKETQPGRKNIAA